MVEGCLYYPAVMVDPLLLVVKDPSLVLDFPVRIWVHRSSLLVEDFPVRVFVHLEAKEEEVVLADLLAEDWKEASFLILVQDFQVLVHLFLLRVEGFPARV